jgi:hypothetical protein
MVAMKELACEVDFAATVKFDYSVELCDGDDR